MHPSKFFEECSIRTGIDVVEVYDENLKEKLKNVHPKNFLKTQIALPVYKITISDQIRQLPKDGKVYGDGEW